MVESGDSGASNCSSVAEASSPTRSIASRTPISSLTSSWTTRIPNVRAYQAIASSRSATAMPT
jgi:hypothetical protein